MRISLVRPPFHSILGKPPFSLFRRGKFSEPLSLLYLGAVLDRKGHDVTIIDGEIIGDKSLKHILTSSEKQIRNLNTVMSNPHHSLWDRITKSILDSSPDLVGITTNTSAMTGVNYLVKNHKEQSKIPILLGGPHVSALPTESLLESSADIVVVGEGENAIIDIANSLMKNRIRTGVIGPYKLIEYLDSIPYPARKLLPKWRYSRRIISGRGCPHRCIFCGSHTIWGRRIRNRSPNNVVGEIKELASTYGAKNFRFNDDTFTLNRQHAIDICEGIKKEALDITFSCNARVDTLDYNLVESLKNAKCAKVTLGIESGSQKILDLLKKGTTKKKAIEAIKILRDVGISSHVYIMINAPFETYDTIQESSDFVNELDPDVLEISMLTPMPGTELWDLYQLQKPKKTEWYKYFCIGHSLMSGPLNQDELYDEYVRLYDVFNRHSFKYLVRSVVGKWIS